MKYLKLKKEDNVRVTSGKSAGKSGRILKIDHQKKRVIVQGLNMVKKTQKPKKQNEKGGIVDIEAPLAASKVMIICKKCGPTRIGYRLIQKEKARICKKCKETL